VRALDFLDRRRSPAIKSVFYAALLVGTSACDLFYPDEAVSERRLATIDYYSEQQAVEVPDTVSAGRVFLVRIRTFGGGCISKGDTEVAVEEQASTPRVEITPHDYELVELPRNTGCTDDLRTYDHWALPLLNRVGVATVVFCGRRKPENDQITVTKSVFVVADTTSHVNAVTITGLVTDSAGRPAKSMIKVLAATPCLPAASRDTRDEQRREISNDSCRSRKL
jgi:hypothetical protein